MPWLCAVGAPVVALNMEPDKRLSHKEVEQRRREKAKQVGPDRRAGAGAGVIAPRACDSRFG
jgi:hypothetical protein